MSFEAILRKGKGLPQVFEGVDIPLAFKDARVASLTVDRRDRRLNLVLALNGFLEHEHIADLSRQLVKHYSLTQITIKPLFNGVSLDNKFLQRYKISLINHLAAVEPMYKYIFEASQWVFDNGLLTVTLVNGGRELLDSRELAQRLERVVKEQTGRTIKVRVHESEEAQPLHANAEANVMPDPVPTAAPAPAAAPKTPVGAIFGRKIKDSPIKIADIGERGDTYVISGKVIRVETRPLKNEKTLFIFDIYDKSSSLTCKCFVNSAKLEAVQAAVQTGNHLTLCGKVAFDSFDQDLTMLVDSMERCAAASGSLVEDNAKVKRIELHTHTKMSAKDGMSAAADLVNRAIKWGHKAIAITDHGVVQAFPEAFAAKEKAGSDIKIIFGVEGYFVEDVKREFAFDQREYVIFDIETTGLSPAANEIIEIGAVKLKNGRIIESFVSFIKPTGLIPEEITRLTGITDDMTADAPSIGEVLADFHRFSADCVLVGHNVKQFDLPFIQRFAAKSGLVFDNPVMDTLTMARQQVPHLERKGLDFLATYFGVDNSGHHRAESDARVCAQIFIKLNELAHGRTTIDPDFKKLPSYHIIILARNQEGLKNLYKLISKSHMDYFHSRPRIPKSLLEQHREGLLLGTACEAGQLYRGLVEGKSPYEIEKIVEYYDYLEIQPLANNEFLINNKTLSGVEDLKRINRTIIELGTKYKKLTVATGDVHFLDPEDELYRRIIMTGIGFTDADNQAPLYLRTTQQMLQELDYLDELTAYKVAVDNPNEIASMIEPLRPVPKGQFSPVMENSEQQIRDMTLAKAHQLYGDPLPEIVDQRIEKELRSIIDNGFSVMYMIAHKLVRRSLDDGYMVGSRGSVGSSLVAFLTGITEVNSLAPHYICANCRHSEFITDGSYSSGCDMPDKICPKCGEPLGKDGHDIPFETFLGFDGDKAPDIDLNFSGVYQPTAHKYTEELLGKGQVFRAGTISGIADKTAFGFVKKYYDGKGEFVSKAEINRLSKRLAGIKQTTGQHPGGIIVVPKGHDIHEFTPIQHPADKSEAGIVTTHFDFHSIDENLLKLDILGHDDPTVIRMLEDLTGKKANTIPLDEAKTKSLFTSVAALNIAPEDIGSEVGTLGVPEFGTQFVRKMLLDTKPTGFADLVRISGLSHGTDVWLNNAQDLVRSGTCSLSQCICTRDDIMVYLLHKGLAPKDAFGIMESVRKGKGLNKGWEDLMRQHQVPDWYINSCNKIKYMFPKAHAAAYVTMAFRIAYYKVYHPLDFYIAYFTVRADVFDYTLMALGRKQVQKNMAELEAMGNAMSQREKDGLTILELCNEFYARGFEFLPIDIMQSHATSFQKVDGKILPPLNSLPGLGDAAAQLIVDARKDGKFNTKQEFAARTKANKTTMELLSKHSIFGDLPESDQLTFM